MQNEKNFVVICMAIIAAFTRLRFGMYVSYVNGLLHCIS